MVGFKKRPRNAQGRHTKALSYNCSKRPTAEECMEHRWILPTDHLVKKRERAVFLGNRLKVRMGWAGHIANHTSTKKPNAS
jgi:hypothetical protein